MGPGPGVGTLSILIESQLQLSYTIITMSASDNEGIEPQRLENSQDERECSNQQNQHCDIIQAFPISLCSDVSLAHAQSLKLAW